MDDEHDDLDDRWGGYVRDIEYTWGYFPEIAPVVLNWVAASNGYRPRKLDGATYMELGCGNAASAAMHAALYPKTQFWGVDFNPKHIANGRSLALDGEVTNLTLLELPFAAMLDADLPDFDFITLHGVWSWIAPEHRDQVLAFVGKKLKPGGVLYVSYNAWPGQVRAEPARRLMVEFGWAKEGSSLDKAREGYAALRRLMSVEARALRHPATQKHVLGLEKHDAAYLVHEYFNRHWTPSYFPDVARPLADLGLSYAGSTDALKNQPGLVTNGPQRELLIAIKDPILRELAKDYAIDEMFRRDVYVRAPRPGPRLDPFQDVAGMRVGTLSSIEDTPRRARFPYGEVSFTDSLTSRIVELACAGSPTLTELARDPAIAAEHSPADVLAAVHMLQAANVVRPFLSASRASMAERWTMPSPLNRLLVEQRILGGPLPGLISPAAGVGFAISRREAVVLDAIVAAGLEGAVRHALAGLERRQVQNPGDLEEEVAVFRARKLGRLARLGVLAPA